jgi:hypothetical protein
MTSSNPHRRKRRYSVTWPRKATWTRQENSVIEYYVQALVRGQFELGQDAARACLKELERLRSKDPQLAARRTLQKVAARVRHLSRRLDWSPRWTPQELRGLEPYALGLVRGKYRLVREAAAAYQARPHTSRASKSGSSRMVVTRSAGSLKYVLLNRARALGRPARSARWSREEARRLDWYAERVVKGRISNAAQAAREFMVEREELRRRRPDVSRLNVPRTLESAHTALWERTRRLGRPFLALRWSLPELRVCRKYARLLLQGKFKTAHDAAPDAEHEIAQLHREHPTERWAGMRRTYAATYYQILKWVRASRRQDGEQPSAYSLQLTGHSPEE